MAGPLGLADVEFWDAPRRTEDEVHDRLLDEGFLGVVIDAPARVPVGKRGTLPIVAVHAATLRETATLSLRAALVAAAVRLETNEVRVARAFAPVSEDDVAPAGIDPGEGTSLRTFDVDLRDRLHLPWEAGTWLVGFFLRERASNRVTVRLEAGGAPRDAVAAAFVAAHRRPRYPQPIAPRPRPGKLPSYEARPDSPPVPAEPGIALAVERLVKDTGDATAVLRGSFRLPVLEREVVKPADAADTALVEALPEAQRPAALKDGLAWQDPGDPRATAVVPITLVVTGSARPGPSVLALQVPSFDPVDPTADAPVVTGHFALDLREGLGWDRLADQTSFIYALSGKAMAGPAAVAVVDPRYVP